MPTSRVQAKNWAVLALEMKQVMEKSTSSGNLVQDNLFAEQGKCKTPF